MSSIEEFILFSGGAAGTEEKFGSLSEQYGIEEVNFTFENHKIKRSRGVRVLNHEELKKGDVSLDYISGLMSRDYPNTKLFKKILQTIWYQINSAQQIFVVGVILDDNTVKGGTGWGAEFAKICNKQLYVFDQDKNEWFNWESKAWAKVDSPKITSNHFCGTGTRFLNKNGENAVRNLFSNSF